MTSSSEESRKIRKGWVSECSLAWHIYEVRLGNFTVSSGLKLEESLKKEKSKSAKVISKKKKSQAGVSFNTPKVLLLLTHRTVAQP